MKQQKRNARPHLTNAALAALVCSLLSGSLFFVLPQAAHAGYERPAEAVKIVNFNYKWSIDSRQEARELAKWDAVIIDVEAAFYTPNRLKLIRQYNPNIKLFAYVSPTDIRKDAADMDKGTTRRFLGRQLEDHPEWILRKKNGKPAQWWEGNYIRNLTNKAPKVNGQRMNQEYARFVRDYVIENKVWDGVFLDNLWEGVSFVNGNIDLDQDGVAESPEKADRLWKEGMKTTIRLINNYAENKRKNFIITGNGGVGYSGQINGVAFEHFPKTSYGKWTKSMEKYVFVIQNAVPGQYAFINTNVENTGSKKDYRKFRYGLMSTLLSEGYYSFDKGDQSHREQWYYDEYDVALGQATSGAYNVLRPDDPTTLRTGVWRRDFEYATVFVNSTSKPHRIMLNSGYEKIRGSQAVSVNSGELVGSVEVPAKDGIILLRRLTQVQDATFINGAFSKVFGRKGKELRSSFFSYDGSFPGGTQIHKLSQNGKTVVADNTWVRIYNRQNQGHAAFAPYGPDYHSGINIAVGRLHGGKRNYIIVGNKEGPPHVRIFNMDGQLVNPGTFPYGTGFRGGVNIGIGDLNGDDKMEIIVAAGSGGGAHIRILDRNCRLINPGFFAFPTHWRFGVNVAVGDLDGNGTAEIIAVPGPGGGPHVRIFNESGKLLSPGFFAYDESDRSGSLITTADIDQDGDDEIVTNSFSIFNSF